MRGRLLRAVLVAVGWMTCTLGLLIVAPVPAVSAPPVLSTLPLSGSAAPSPDIRDVVGSTLAHAVDQLQSMGVTDITTVPDSLPGTVDPALVLVRDVEDISVNIDPGPTYAVRLSLEAELPDLTGLTPDQAREQLAARGLQAVFDRSTRDPGLVVTGQDPSPGERLALPGQVQLTLAVPVPDIVGQTLEEARATITGAGLQLSVDAASSTGLTAVVDRQDPSAGTPVNPGAEVTARLVARVSPPVTAVVPDLTGLTPAQADRLLDGLGLRLPGPAQDYPADGVAADQNPPAGTEVPLGSTIEVAFETPAGDHESTGPSTGASSGSGAWVWWVAATALVGLLGGTALTVRSSRNARQRAWARDHLRVEAHPSPAPQPRLEPTGDAPGWTIRLEPHPDPGRQAAQEVHR